MPASAIASAAVIADASFASTGALFAATGASVTTAGATAGATTGAATGAAASITRWGGIDGQHTVTNTTTNHATYLWLLSLNMDL